MGTGRRRGPRPWQLANNAIATQALPSQPAGSNPLATASQCESNPRNHGATPNASWLSAWQTRNNPVQQSYNLDAANYNTCYHPGHRGTAGRVWCGVVTMQVVYPQCPRANSARSVGATRLQPATADHARSDASPILAGRACVGSGEATTLHCATEQQPHGGTPAAALLQNQDQGTATRRV